VTERADRVLVVDDEPPICEFVALGLRHEGFEVEIATTARAALGRMHEFRPDLVVLDVMLPDLDGFEVLRRLREAGEPAGVIFLTACADPTDRVAGLRLGGDDYLGKPFSLDELVARARAVLRRLRGSSQDDGKLRYADLELDEGTHEVWRAGRPLRLTPTEFRFLRYLMLNPRLVLSKSQILQHVWQYDFEGDANVVETYVSYLRRKVDAQGPPLIHTVRGVGYSLRVAAREE
jgi:two-component system OmpR family response regulator